ncbi:MAG TPA: YCF48-related protein [Aromatoleum sp.]|uniref:WD40/YVTN/BNR-like repeat-containing protein n=1 Tax=Aromatoleum sp. TaxID=2307007 RepID=UPI002B4A70F3|nr:YCF48-related protein [Aromatoleum sp.]HJV27697.1 YCF48-related protein [Aromatoleum sp.]
MAARKPHAFVRRVLAAALFAATAGAVAGQAATDPATPRVIRNGAAHDALFDLAFEGRQGIAVGAFGTILASEDGGANWRSLPAPAKTPVLLGVAMRAGRCLAVGQMGAVLAADDCRQWKNVASGNSSRLMAVSLNRDGLAYAVGAFGTVLRSGDGGLSWAPVAIDWHGIGDGGAEPHLYDVHVSDAGSVTVVGEFGVILRSADGARWQTVHRGEQALFGLAVKEGAAYAVGQAGTVLASTDGGNSWKALHTGSAAILTGVWSDGRGRVVASGINAILRSEDGGASWRAMDSRLATRAAHNAVAAAAGEAGKPRVMTTGSAATLLDVAQ